MTVVLIAKWKQWARTLKTNTYALYLAYKDPRTPLVARLWTAAVVAYALSPIDLIPDFIPILGYLDDLILVPLGIAIAVKLIPHEVMIGCREQAVQQMSQRLPANRTAAIIIVAIWLLAALLSIALIYRAIIGK